MKAREKIWKMIKTKILGAKVRYRMLILYLVGGVIPMILIGNYLIQGTDRLLIKQAKNTEVTEVEMVQTQVKELVNTATMVSKYFFFNEQLEKISRTQYTSYQEQVTDFKNFTAFDDYGNYYNNMISHFSIYIENDTMIGNSRIVKVDDTIRSEAWYQNAIDTKGGTKWGYFRTGTGSYGYDSLALTRMVKTSKGENVGLLVLHIQPERLNETISARDYDTMIVLNGETLVSEKDGNAIDFRMVQKELPGEESTEKQKVVQIGDEKYVMTCAAVSMKESRDYLQVVSLRSYADIVGKANQQNRKSVILFLVSIALASILMIEFSSSFAKRVERFHAQMQKAAKGNFELEEHLGGNDEISELYDYLGTMIWKIQKLISDVYREQLHAEQLKIEQKEAEFKMLASQINPHFLYNTLEVIRMKARASKQYDIEELVKMLAKILRKNIQAGSQDVEIQTEVELITCYLKIQQYRFGERIQYEIDMDPEMEHIRILPLILQPIVENSIVHGLEVKEGIGHIRISISRKDSDLLVVVEDDGVGMEKEQLEALRSNMNRRNENGTHIGMQNVHQRIRLRYGENYGLELDSASGVGTRVKIRIPIEE